SVADVGKGSSDVIQFVYVPTPGFFPVRTVWWQGGGGGSFEWVAVSPSGVRTLINDSTVPGSVKAYRARTGNTPTAFVYANPVRSSGTFRADTAVTIEIADGSPVTVTDGTI